MIKFILRNNILTTFFIKNNILVTNKLKVFIIHNNNAIHREFQFHDPSRRVISTKPFLLTSIFYIDSSMIFVKPAFILVGYCFAIHLG